MTLEEARQRLLTSTNTTPNATDQEARKIVVDHWNRTSHVKGTFDFAREDPLDHAALTASILRWTHT